MEDNREDTHSQPETISSDSSDQGPQIVQPTAPDGAFFIARIGVYMPVFVLLSSLGASWAFYGMMMLYGLLCLLALVTGLTCAILTFKAVRRYGKKGLLGKALAGLVMNGFLLFGTWLKDAESKTIASREQREAQALRKSYYDNLEVSGRKEALDEPRQEKRQSPEADANRAALAEQLRAASGISREEFDGMDDQSRRVLEASLTFAQELRRRHQELHNSTVNIFRAKMFKADSYSSKDQVNVHRQIVTNFLEASHSVSNFSHHSAAYLHSEMKSLGVNEEELRDSIGRFNLKFKPRFAVQQQAYKLNDHFAGLYLSALDLVEQQYEKWSVHQLDGSILMSDEAAAEKFARIMEEIETTKQVQTELGKEEAKLMK